MEDKQNIPLREIIKKEYAECLKSPAYFMKKYCKIQHPTLGTIPFDLYDFQTKTLESFRDEQFNIVLKARQLGISTLVSGYALWLMTFFTDKSILCIAINQETAKNVDHLLFLYTRSLPMSRCGVTGYMVWLTTRA